MSSSSSPCAACKLLRRKCTQGCVFAPYFPPDQPAKFANVHRVFGASNVAKLLNELPPAQREDAVNSLAYEADARLRDPVYGCVAYISILQLKIKQVRDELALARKELASYVGPAAFAPFLPAAAAPHHPAAAFLGPHQYQAAAQYGVPGMGLGLATGVSGAGGVTSPYAHMLMREQQHQHHQQQQQMVEAQQQLAAAVEVAREQEMLRRAAAYRGGGATVAIVPPPAESYESAFLVPHQTAAQGASSYHIEPSPTPPQSHSHMELSPSTQTQTHPSQHHHRAGSDEGSGAIVPSS